MWRSGSHPNRRGNPRHPHRRLPGLPLCVPPRLPTAASPPSPGGGTYTPRAQVVPTPVPPAHPHLRLRASAPGRRGARSPGQPPAPDPGWLLLCPARHLFGHQLLNWAGNEPVLWSGKLRAGGLLARAFPGPRFGGFVSTCLCPNRRAASGETLLAALPWSQRLLEQNCILCQTPFAHPGTKVCNCCCCCCS